MPRNPEKNHLRAWRELRRMTQAQLAEMIETTGAVISLLESGDRRLSDKWARKLGPALGIQPGWLLDVHPDDVDNDVFEIWSEIPAERREQALDVLKTFRIKPAAKSEAPSSPTPPRRRGTKAD
jgi:transcriptional regulator with XRE-family HTH domain